MFIAGHRYSLSQSGPLFDGNVVVGASLRESFFRDGRGRRWRALAARDGDFWRSAWIYSANHIRALSGFFGCGISKFVGGLPPLRDRVVLPWALVTACDGWTEGTEKRFQSFFCSEPNSTRMTGCFPRFTDRKDWLQSASRVPTSPAVAQAKMCQNHG